MSLICIISNQFTHSEKYQNTTSNFPPSPQPTTTPSGTRVQSRGLGEHAVGLQACGRAESRWLSSLDHPRSCALCGPVSKNSTTVLNSLFSTVIDFQSVIPVLLVLDQDLGFCLNQYFLWLRSYPLTIFAIYPWVTLPKLSEGRALLCT